MNSDTKIFEFRLQLLGKMKEMAHVRISNGYMETVHSGYGEVATNLQKGVYTVIVSINEYKEEFTVILDKNIDKLYKLPEVFSSIPGNGFKTSNEEAMENAEIFSKEVTTANENAGVQNSSIFIFFSRVENPFTPTKRILSLGSGFSILNQRREKIYGLNKDSIREPDNKKWLAFHVNLPVGLYYISYKRNSGELNREFPLYIFYGWQTQIFLTFDQAPLFASLRFNIERNYKGFRRNSDSYFLMEAIIHKAQSGIFHSPFGDLWELAIQKWEEPMKGLLAIYMLLANGNLSPQTSMQIIDNLSYLLGDNVPDIKALRIMHAQRFEIAPPDITIDEPCMFLMGMQAAVKGVQSKQLVAAGSPAENLLEDLYTDLIWTSSNPKPFKSGEFHFTAKRDDSINNEFEERHFSKRISDFPISESAFDLEPPSSINVNQPITRVENGPRTPQLPRKPKILNSWVANVLLEEIGRVPKENKNLDTQVLRSYSVNDLAVSLQLTPTLISSTIRQLVSDERKIIAWAESSGTDEEKKYISLENFRRLQIMS